MRVILLVDKKQTLSEVQRYDFDSLLKHQFTRDNTFALIRSRKCFSWTKKSYIYLLLLNVVSLYLITWSLTAVRADVICFDRMVVDQWLKFDMMRDLKWFLCSFGRTGHIYQFWHKFIFVGVSIWCKISLSFASLVGTYALVEFSSPSKHPRSIFSR